MKSLLASILVCYCTTSVAQQLNTELAKPLILIDTLATFNECMIIHPSKLVSISTISPQKATQLYGNTGKFGVIRIETVPNIAWVRLNEILDKFNVQEQYRKL